jgi:hypothetical protein
MMMNETLKQYEQTPDVYWANASLYGDGYDVMEAVAARGWKPMPSWGKDGYDLGSWPYVIIYTAKQEWNFCVVEYVEGDITMYACPTKEIREQVINELAFFHWKHSAEEWVSGYEAIDQLPEELRGPYRQ